MADQIPYLPPTFLDPTLVENPEARCAVVLLLDTSGSMRGAPITELNEGLVALKDSLAADALASKRVELCVVTFGPVQVQTEFTTPDRWHPPVLVASGETPMGEAIVRGLDLLETRKQQYRSSLGDGHYYRPWVFLITDGGPTDEWTAAAARVHAGEADKKFMFYAVAVEGARLEILARIAPPTRAPLMLRGLAFRELFAWLSSSLRAVSASRTTETVLLENPTAPGGWGATT